MKYLIVGLGNIGDDYVGTRHNIGFEVVESLGKKFGGEWKSVKHGSLCEVSHKGRKLLLLKPNTYMNLSGKAVSFWMQAEKIKLENVVIITDDLALPVAKLRLKSKGSDGGHNGLKSIQEVDFVLGKFTTEERSSIDIAIDRAVEGTLQYCTLGAGFAMNYTNT